MLAWIILNWKSALAVIIGLTIGLSFGKIYGEFKGEARGKALCEAEYVSNTLERIQKNAKNLQEVRRLDDAALVRRYCRWVFDVPYDECVRSTVFVP